MDRSKRFKRDPYYTEADNLANEGKLAEACVEFIRVRDHVSFAELRDFLSSYIPVAGEFLMEFTEHPNLCLWGAMTEEFVAVMRDLQATKQVVMEPSSVLVYLIDGGILKMPIAKRPRKGGYKKPHWLPTVFRHKSRV